MSPKGHPSYAYCRELLRSGFFRFLKIGYAVLNEQVIPLNQFLDVRGIHTVTVKVGKHLAMYSASSSLLAFP